MRQPHFPTYGLMIFVGMLSLWLIAVGRPSEVLTSLVFTGTIAVLGFATLLAFAHRDEHRHFWKGFMICGWLYFFFAIGSMLKAGDAPHFLPEILLNDIYLYATTGQTYFIHELSKPVPSPRPHFVKNGQALIALLLGLGGGFLAQIIAAREVRE